MKKTKKFSKLYSNCKLNMVDTGYIVMYKNPEGGVSVAIKQIYKMI